MIYLASPYTHPDPAVREARFRRACIAAGEMLCAGHIVYSPIAHTHPIAQILELPSHWEFWERYDREMIKLADTFAVLKIDGWRESKGVQAEIRIALKMGIRIEYKEDE